MTRVRTNPVENGFSSFVGKTEVEQHDTAAAVALQQIFCLRCRADGNGIEASFEKHVAKDIPEVVRIFDHHNVGHGSSPGRILPPLNMPP